MTLLQEAKSDNFLRTNGIKAANDTNGSGLDAGFPIRPLLLKMPNRRGHLQRKLSALKRVLDDDLFI
jgi:hypothetical protein